MSFSLEHLDHRPRSTPAGGVAGRGAPEDVNWFPLVRAAFLGALTAFLVKLVALGFFANRRDINLEVGFWKGFIPHLSMQTPPADFAQIVTASTLVMAVVSTVIFAAMVLRPRADKMVVWGWFMGVFVTFETLCLELLRHVLEPPVIDPTTVWRAAIPLTAGAAIAVVYGVISREPLPAPTPVAARTITLAGPDGGRSVDTRPAAFQGAPAAPVEVAAPVSAPVGLVPAPAVPAPAVPAWTPPVPRPSPAPVPVGATVSAALAAAVVPNRVVDTRRPAAVVDRDPADLPPTRTPVARPAADVGPAPIVDTRPAAQRTEVPDPGGSNGLSTRSPLTSKE